MHYNLPALHIIKTLNTYNNPVLETTNSTGHTTPGGTYYNPNDRLIKGQKLEINPH